VGPFYFIEVGSFCLIVHIFRIGVIAYNLFIGFKRLSLPAEWDRHTMATLRWKLIEVAGRIVRHAGQVILKLAVDTQRLILFQGIRQRSYEVAEGT
jgi:hypothetical protein